MSTVKYTHDGDPAAIADWLALQLKPALAATQGTVAITIPGGSTPFPILADLVKRDLDWSRLEVWPNDDRIVPEDHEASNTGKMRALLEPVGARVVGLTEGAQPPHFALTWLGMGPDGHIASLFPNTDPQLDDPRCIRRLTPDPLPAHAPFDRITLTLQSLLATGAILFTLGGSDEKRQVFEAGALGEHDLPVARLLQAAQNKGDIDIACFT
ncbi:6-phosphogluconolactonase [Erythrobacter insulae]|uniref:6-phosphogluconolactonase n=1 Tax=Erythrobacter insulae TaxID=2584124 RepID=A0A547PCI1_9SPHN|nr:6-phosphogluconolactonase [Erythrobacter insulae]TRD11841.1 6-phosphogluconolactonase [Erythrobacter insulae]